MAEKRKSEDASVAVKPKKFKRNKKFANNKKKSEGRSNGHSTNDSLKKENSGRLSLKPPQNVQKKPDENTNKNNEGQNKTGKKSKMWKHWERRKKQHRNKLKNSTNELKTKSVTNSPPPVSSNKGHCDNPEKKIDERTVEVKKPVQSVSCNWKKLKMDIEKTKPKKKFKKKIVKKSQLNKTEKKEPESAEPDIWFDDVDEELLKPKKETQANKLTANKTISRQAKSADGLVKEHSFKGPTKAVALDCEMVGVGEGGKESVLARVSVVNQFGECLYDTFVRSREDVVDYRTKWSGVTPEKLENATDFLDAQKAVSDLLRGRILVGHAVHHDLKVLFLDHPHKDIRDTSRYKPYKQMFKGRTPSLKNLTSRLLSVKIQTGEHNSVTDAQAAMRLYTFSRKEWEGHLKRRKIRKPKTSNKKMK